MRKSRYCTRIMKFVRVMFPAKSLAPHCLCVMSCVCNSASGIWCSIKFDRDRQTDRQTDRWTDTSSLFYLVDKPVSAVPRGCVRGPAVMAWYGRLLQVEATMLTLLCSPSCVCNSASVIWCSIKFDRDRRTDRQTDASSLFTELTSRLGAAPSQ
jgi:hypothetical protein